ncbi:polyphosphate kinase 2 [Methylopila capsulata]|uniref:ADP/GDP-polyphosphate phosphotransferase n=1 Tax=Methylopila capsulata TaxID=61654 RepID=A0A9W6IRV4_9HYPH|nr:polyphosphate kinase 2 [Methylopila capsulata]MBM7851978.1 polyphosphate kinase 2 [Methylopila capsulata]GLK55043.1 polyphosphate kinase 2 [Methylopila capsulata]
MTKKPKADETKKKTAAEALLDEVVPEGAGDAPKVMLGGVEVDLDAADLPPEVETRAFGSGGFPYEDSYSHKAYSETLRLLQIELLKLQAWAKTENERIVVVFEGRDSAGKGGTIHRITQHLNPRSLKVVALGKPTPVEAGQWYFQRYLAEMPTAGEIALFDRSWYNRAGVEPVMGFCTAEETARFLDEAPRVERLLVDDGVRLFKFWLTIGREMQIKRLHDRRHDPLKRWKLSPIDYAGLNLWDSFSHAAERMLAATHTDAAPWTVVRANDKRRLRLECIRHLLLNVPYKGRNLKAIGGADSRIVMDAAAFLKDGGEH